MNTQVPAVRLWTKEKDIWPCITHIAVRRLHNTLYRAVELIGAISETNGKEIPRKKKEFVCMQTIAQSTERKKTIQRIVPPPPQKKRTKFLFRVTIYLYCNTHHFVTRQTFCLSIDYSNSPTQNKIHCFETRSFLMSKLF